jgi:hypothetical protein
LEVDTEYQMDRYNTKLISIQKQIRGKDSIEHHRKRISRLFGYIQGHYRFVRNIIEGNRGKSP